MIKDPIVEEVHRIRDRLAAEAGYDARKFFKMIKDAEKHSGRKFERLRPKKLSASGRRS